MSIHPIATTRIHGHDYAEYGAETYLLDSKVYNAEDAPTVLARRPIESTRFANLVGFKFLGGIALLSDSAQRLLPFRQQQYAVLKAAGMENEDIARSFNIKPSTFKTQLGYMAAAVFDDRPTTAMRLLPKAKIGGEYLFDIPEFDASDRTHCLKRRLGGLSQRESVVTEALSKGNSLREIAATEFVSLTTVKTQIDYACEKLGVHTRTLVVAACLMDNPHIREDTPTQMADPICANSGRIFT